MSIVVKAQVKNLTEGYNVSSDFMQALDSEVRDLVERALERADQNGRKTVMARDL
jgi:histone H3/H4